MNLELSHAMDSIKDGTKEIAETAHAETSEFHKKYVSNVVPDFGKYGDAAKFVAEMAPGVSEYNAIREGDWQAFAIAAGIDVASIAVGAVTAGTGYAAVKGGSAAAKAGVKVAAKEILEAGAEKAVKEVVEAGTEKVAKEAAKAGAEKVAKEVAEAGAEKAVKEVVEAGTEKVAKEAAKAGAEKVAKETAEAGAEKAVKEVAEAGAEKVAKEAAESGTEKAAKELTESGIEKTTKEIDEGVKCIKNKQDGLNREKEAFKKLVSDFGEENILREQFLRNKAGEIIKDPITNEARRIDFIVTKGKEIVRSVEVTSLTADKAVQTEKELRILKQAIDNGGAFIKNMRTGEMCEFTLYTTREIWRLP